MTCAPFGVHVRHSVQRWFSPLAATDPVVALEEVHQEQPAAGGAICTREDELCDGPQLTGKPTVLIGHALCMPCTLSPEFTVKIYQTQYLVSFYLATESQRRQFNKPAFPKPSNNNRRRWGWGCDLRTGGLPCGTHVVRPINEMDQRSVAQPFN